MAKKRCAVVIGVNKTGELDPLESPVEGAEEFGAFLKAEGFETKIITDRNGPVKADKVKEAIEKFVKAATYDQMVLYFSGHGYWKNRSELWLLSEAPGNADEAINWTETIDYAQDCGIPNVVIISDACRSIPQTVTANRVRGSVVFPNEPPVRQVSTKIDKLMASLHGAPSYEIRLKDNEPKVSVFTHCLREAFKSPDQDMVRQVTEDGTTFEIVPNRKLENYLRREVGGKLSAINIKFEQLPVVDAPSDDDAYIGRVRRPQPTPQPRVLRGGRRGSNTGALESTARPRETPVDIQDVASTALAQALNPKRGAPAAQANSITAVADQSGFTEIEASVRRHVGSVRRFETETGFSVTGKNIAEVVGGNNRPVDIVAPGDGQQPGIVRVHISPERACSVAVRFGDGTGILLAALQGYIGHVSTGPAGVINVSYVPAENSFRWKGYEERRQKVETLRAAVAAAAQFGAFKIDKDQAASFAQTVRMDKAYDPTLGLYAAYAYAEACRPPDIVSVRNYMRDDLGVDLFDVAMLARSRNDPTERKVSRIFPACPMLTQGWNLLRARRIQMHPVFAEAEHELLPALWTTFRPDRVTSIMIALRNGALT